MVARILTAASAAWLWRSYIGRGFVQLGYWRQARAPGVYSLDAPYLSFGLLRLLSGAAVVALAARPELFLPERWARKGWARVLPAVLALAGGWAVRLDFRPLEVRYYELQKRALVRSMNNVADAVQRCGQDHGRRYPAAASECTAVPDILHTAASPYRFRGESVPYRAVFVPDAEGPLSLPPEGAAPGTFFLAVSRDRTRYWGTAAALPVRRGLYAQDFAVEISSWTDWQRGWDNPRDKPVVMAGLLPPIPSPSVPPRR